MAYVCSIEVEGGSIPVAMKDVLYDSVGMGRDMRFDRKGIVGSAL
jgi:hypothetical protein